ncbi:MAG: PaaI family thioesterase [Pseudomonadota bacterium]
MQYDPSLPWRNLKGEGFNDHIGPVRFARAADALWQGTLVVDHRHRNSGGVCHGGVSLTLADLTMGAASYEAAGSRPCSTIQMDSHFIAAGKEGQRLLAIARQLRLVRDLSFMSCEIWALDTPEPGAEGRQILRASGIWKYLASRKPGDRGNPAAG